MGSLISKICAVGFYGEEFCSHRWTIQYLSQLLRFKDMTSCSIELKTLHRKRHSEMWQT